MTCGVESVGGLVASGNTSVRRRYRRRSRAIVEVHGFVSVTGIVIVVGVVFEGQACSSGATVQVKIPSLHCSAITCAACMVTPSDITVFV